MTHGQAVAGMVEAGAAVGAGPGTLWAAAATTQRPTPAIAAARVPIARAVRAFTATGATGKAAAAAGGATAMMACGSARPEAIAVVYLDVQQDLQELQMYKHAQMLRAGPAAECLSSVCGLEAS